MRPADIKKAVRENRRNGESRLQQSKRTGIPYVTLRRMELNGYRHSNRLLRDAYMAILGQSKAMQ